MVCMVVMVWGNDGVGGGDGGVGGGGGDGVGGGDGGVGIIMTCSPKYCALYALKICSEKFCYDRLQLGLPRSELLPFIFCN